MGLFDEVKKTVEGTLSGGKIPVLSTLGSRLKVAPSSVSSVTKCKTCGAALSSEAKFCPACGTPVPVVVAPAVCTKCGTQLADGAKFCTSCGTPASGVIPAAPAASAAPPQTTAKVGNIRKCPSCGAEVPAMTVVCPSCGHEFREVKVTSSVQAFADRLDAIDQENYNSNRKKDEKGPIGGALGAMLGIDHMAKQVTEYYGRSPGAKRKMEMIESFPIPNAKEDIIEFCLMAVSRVRVASRNAYSKNFLIPNSDADKLNQAWKTKCDQAYTKAKFLFGDDKAAIAEIASLLKAKKVIK